MTSCASHPALTFHVIRLSNSVLFGLRERNDSLEGAVGRVSFNESYRLVGLAATNQVCQRDLPTYQLKAGVSESDLATCASRARDHYAALCASLE
ncbi:MAG: hypothetical protein CK548_06760 [Opitutia bacterium]|nr:MAG: hypothetical protein CK548_06760 [Opitutae bacterium]